MSYPSSPRKPKQGTGSHDPLPDLRVLVACLDTETPPTEAVIGGIWRWFFDVELILPLPVMSMEDDERNRLGKEIASEMVEAFERIAKYRAAAESIKLPFRVSPEDAAIVDNLWRELAGCYAEQVNRQVPTVEMDEEEAESFYGSFVSRTADMFDVSEDEIREALRTDSSFRMMLRLQGYDPDRAR